MAIYKVIGRGVKTNRKRTREYVTDTEAEARALAEKDETTPETVELLLACPLDTDIAGVGHKNANNTSRQRIVSESKLGELLILEHEKGNRHDANAIRVLRQNGEQLGYLPREIAYEVMQRWTRNGKLPQYVLRNEEFYQHLPGQSAMRIHATGYLVLAGVTATEASSYLRSNAEVDSEALKILDNLTALVSRPRQKQQRKSPRSNIGKSEPSGCLTLIVAVVIALCVAQFV